MLWGWGSWLGWGGQVVYRVQSILKYQTIRFDFMDVMFLHSGHHHPSATHVAIFRVVRTTYVLTPWNRVLLEKLTGSQIVKKFPAFYGNQRFITAVTSARHLSLTWASSIQSIPPTSHFLKIHLNSLAAAVNEPALHRLLTWHVPNLMSPFRC